MRGVDLFCGARGHEAIAHRTLGVDLLGIDWWEPAVRTSEAAGLRTLHADVAALDPHDFEGPLLVASPPCQSYSAAGKGAGREDIGRVLECTRDLAAGRDSRAEHRAACGDERSMLTVEPLRWALALRPVFVVLEQVPPVLPYWRVVGELLGGLGYSWWAGLLSSERYGVAQTRERAILIARRDGRAAHPPVPTHHRFVPNEPRPVASVDLLGDVLPWVSMAEALGWDGREYRLSRGEGFTERHGDRRAVPMSEPAPTLRFGGRSNDVSGVTGQARNSGPGAERTPRPIAAPSYTIRSQGSGSHPSGVEWVHERPATTVNGDPRISRPGHHDPDESGSQQRDAVRVTVAEAAALQSFPAGWPFAGAPERPNSRTAQFQLVGNSVPPLLGEAIFRTVMP